MEEGLKQSVVGLVSGFASICCGQDKGGASYGHRHCYHRLGTELVHLGLVVDLVVQDQDGDSKGSSGMRSEKSYEKNEMNEYRVW